MQNEQDSQVKLIIQSNVVSSHKEVHSPIPELIASDGMLRLQIIKLISDSSDMSYEMRLNNLQWALHYTKDLLENFTWIP